MSKRISNTLFTNIYILNKLSKPLNQYRLLDWGTQHQRRNNDVYTLTNQPFSVTFKQDMYDAWLLIETNDKAFTVSLVGDDKTVSDNYKKMLEHFKQLLSENIRS